MKNGQVVEAANRVEVNILQQASSTVRAKGTTERSDLVTLNYKGSAARRSSQSNGR